MQTREKLHLVIKCQFASKFHSLMASSSAVEIQSNDTRMDLACVPMRLLILVLKVGKLLSLC